MGGLLLKLQNFKKVKLIFGHPVVSYSRYRFLPSKEHDSQGQYSMLIADRTRGGGTIPYSKVRFVRLKSLIVDVTKIPHVFDILIKNDKLSPKRFIKFDKLSKK